MAAKLKKEIALLPRFMHHRKPFPFFDISINNSRQ